MSENERKNISFSNNRQAIRRLTQENRQLQRENDALKKELEEYRGSGIRKLKSDRYHGVFEKQATNGYLFSKKNYLSYIYAHLKSTSLFHIYKRIINAIRRYTFITTSIKLVSFIFAIVETGTLVVISTSAFVVSVPFSLAASLIPIATTLIFQKKFNTKNKRIIEGKNVVIFYPTSNRAWDCGAYFSGFVREWAEKKNSVVIIVSPHLFKSIGLDSSKKKYLLSRQEADNILLVRKSYYFSIKKRVIDPFAKDVTEIF